MKILIFSDLHLHNWPYGSNLIDGMNSRLLDGFNVMTQISEYIEDNPVDMCVFGGDLFHTHGKIDSAVLKVAYEGMSIIHDSLNRQFNMIILVGNHDTSDKSMKVHNLHWMKALGINVVDKPQHTGFSPDTAYVRSAYTNFSFLPYTEDKDVIKQFFKDAAKKQGTSLGTENGIVCFMHQGIAEVPMGSGFLIDEIFTLDMIPYKVKHVFTGHYHTHTRVSDKATVIGSTMQLNWSDEGSTKGFLIVDTDTGEIEQIESVAPKFVTYDMVNALRLGRKHPVVVEGNFLRVTSYEEKFKEDIRKMLTEAGARSVEFVAEKVDDKRLQTPSTCDGFHLPSLVADYEKDQDVSDERSKVGKEIMK